MVVIGDPILSRVKNAINLIITEQELAVFGHTSSSFRVKTMGAQASWCQGISGSVILIDRLLVAIAIIH